MTAVLDFAMLPPEVNSARMYSGAGSASMLAAASAWKGVAAELRSTALSYGAVLSALTDEEWQGPASAAMADAAAPYVAWMNTTAVQAEQAASQAEAAAAAYETAFAATVPPPEIAANRAQLVSLVSTNFLGLNTPAIAATEAQYGEMWGQDTAAMYGYAGSSAVASQLTMFAPPQPIVNPAATTAQSAAMTQAAATSAGTGQSAVSKLMTSVPGTLQSLAAPAASTGSAPAATAGGGLDDLLNSPIWNNFGPNATIWNTIFSSGFYMPSNFVGSAADFMGLGQGAGGAAARRGGGRGGRGRRPSAGNYNRPTGQPRSCGQRRVRRPGCGTPGRRANGTSELDGGRAPDVLRDKCHTDGGSTSSSGSRHARSADGRHERPGLPQRPPIRLQTQLRHTPTLSGITRCRTALHQLTPMRASAHGAT